MRGKVAKSLRAHAKIIAGAKGIPEAWKELYKRLKKRYKEEYHASRN